MSVPISNVVKWERESNTSSSSQTHEWVERKIVKLVIIIIIKHHKHDERERRHIETCIVEITFWSLDISSLVQTTINQCFVLFRCSHTNEMKGVWASERSWNQERSFYRDLQFNLHLYDNEWTVCETIMDSYQIKKLYGWITIMNSLLKYVSHLFSSFFRSFTICRMIVKIYKYLNLFCVDIKCGSLKTRERFRTERIIQHLCEFSLSHTHLLLNMIYFCSLSKQYFS